MQECYLQESKNNKEAKIIMKHIAIGENHLYSKAYSKGAKYIGRTVIVYVLKDLKARLLQKAHPDKQMVNRIGLTVSKKLGHAVVRNRARRRLREVYRLNEAMFKPGFDIVVVARHRCVTADFQKLTKAYLSLAQKAGILVEK